jgi:tetratricopeptide (TPR) repeat protein
MHSEAIWQRAVLLAGQRRWDLAGKELRALLAQEPDHAPAHALLAQVLAATGDLDGALHEARQAVGAAPDFDFAHGVLAQVLWQRDELPAAATAIAQAIALDPDDSSHHALLAQIRLGQRRFDDALAAADDGLRVNPQDTDCLNLRSVALTRLGRGREATDTLDASLAHDPENPYTHQARGFALLHQGDPRGALVHFQEALRRDPQLRSARAGLVEALKAKNPLYRVVLAWFLWLGRFSGARQMQIAVGLWLLARLGAEGLDGAGAPVAADVVRYSWLAFVLVTACAVPIFNLLLLLHPIGRHALERRARRDALCLGATVLVSLGVGLGRLCSGPVWTQGWIFWLILLMPVAGIGLFEPGWGRRTLQAFCAAAAATWIAWAIAAHRWAANATAVAAPSGGEPDPVRLRAALEATSGEVEWLGTLILATALSTWFVLLAPKGRPRRGIGADSDD